MSAIFYFEERATKKIIPEKGCYFVMGGPFVMNVDMY